MDKQVVEEVVSKKEKTKETKEATNYVEEFSIEDVWTTGCALNTTGKIDN